mmetsp:Transcript_128735/g.412400  ORF Transcript_128735/g.412400 Transcript_128735/m.412400 type:complete len:253 (+) Transcript_128735:227-985(+)
MCRGHCTRPWMPSSTSMTSRPGAGSSHAPHAPRPSRQSAAARQATPLFVPEVLAAASTRQEEAMLQVSSWLGEKCCTFGARACCNPSSGSEESEGLSSSSSTSSMRRLWQLLARLWPSLPSKSSQQVPVLPALRLPLLPPSLQQPTWPSTCASGSSLDTSTWRLPHKAWAAVATSAFGDKLSGAFVDPELLPTLWVTSSMHRCLPFKSATAEFMSGGWLLKTMSAATAFHKADDMAAGITKEMKPRCNHNMK